MDSLTLTSAGVGAVLPLLVSVVVRSSWPGWLKGLIVLASSVVVGALTAYTTGQLTGGTWLQGTLTVGASALAAYKLWWQPTGIGPAIEKATQPSTPVPTKTGK